MNFKKNGHVKILDYIFLIHIFYKTGLSEENSPLTTLYLLGGYMITASNAAEKCT